MKILSLRSMALWLVLLAAAFAYAPKASAEPYFQGPRSCQECHKEIGKTWEETKHFLSYRTAHKNKIAKKIAIAVGGKKNMKRNKKCSICHYSTEQKKPDGKAKVKYGPSCESCHGAASDWEDMHLNYGGKDVKKEQETPEHKSKRIADSTAAGLAWAANPYDIAVNCAKCHGLARPEISNEDFAKMLGAKHPLKQSFEIVMYSQGKMRHWPDKRSPAQLARLFIAGQAAKLVSATAALAKPSDAAYKAVQEKRAADARAALQVVPQAAALIASPSDANARQMMQKIGQQDMSGLVNGLFPCPAAEKKNLRQC